MINTTNKTMALKFEMLSDNEITKFAKNPAGFEKMLSKLTSDEISLLLERIDELANSVEMKEMFAYLMRLKVIVLEEEALREERAS